MPDCSTRVHHRGVAVTGLAVVGLAFFGLLSALVILGSWPSPASAQVNRCERADGIAAYTDRSCSDLGAVESEPRRDDPGIRRIHHGGCARSVHDLMFEMTTAIDAGDANRLASVYHWPGTSGGAAAAVMTRLDEVVRRPLVDIVPIQPSTRPSPRYASDSGPAVPTRGYTRGYQYPSTIEQTPVALRVVQTLANGSTPSDTVFDLHRHFGCLWIRG